MVIVSHYSQIGLKYPVFNVLKTRQFGINQLSTIWILDTSGILIPTVVQSCKEKCQIYFSILLFFVDKGEKCYTKNVSKTK